MVNIIAIFIFLLVIGLSINAVQAVKNFNSSKSNTSSIMVKEGLDEMKVRNLLEKFEVSDNTLQIDEDLLKEELRNIAIPDDQAERILSSLRKNAAQELAAKLPKAGLTPSSPFYFLERWTEAVGEFFTFSPQAKARLQVKRALERLAEVEAMLAQKEVEPRGIDIALARLEGNLEKASRIVEEEKSKGRDVSALAKELDARFGTQRVFLEGTLGESALEVIEIKDGDDMTIRKRPGLTKYSNIILRRGELETTFEKAKEKFERAKIKEEPAPSLPETPPIPADKAKPSAVPLPKEKLPPPPLLEEQPAAGRIEPKTGAQDKAVFAAPGKNYNSSISKTFTVGKIREAVGNILLRYGIGGAEINRVTDALERGISESELKSLLSEIGLPPDGINETVLKLDELGAAFPSQ